MKDAIQRRRLCTQARTNKRTPPTSQKIQGIDCRAKQIPAGSPRTSLEGGPDAQSQPKHKGKEGTPEEQQLAKRSVPWTIPPVPRAQAKQQAHYEAYLQLTGHEP